MGKSIDQRIEDLLDQLENRYLSEGAIQKIKEKVEFLEAQRKKQ